VDYRDDLNLRTACKLKLPYLTEEELTKQLPMKDRRKKTKQNKTLPNLPVKTTTELLLKYEHQDWMLEE
jgi:hypothetical protein